MSLYATVGEHLKEAMKAGDAPRRDALRMLQSAAKNVAIDKRKPVDELTDQEMEDVVRRLTKQRKDSIEQYRAGGREDLASKEEAELALLSAYLPASMPEAELKALVEAALQGAGITEKAKMGQAMGVVMKQVAGRASGDDVRRMVEMLLS